MEVKLGILFVFFLNIFDLNERDKLIMTHFNKNCNFFHFRYGVSHSHVGFVLDATYTFILALIQVMCICYYKKSGMPAGVEPLPRVSRYGSHSRIPHEMMRRLQDSTLYMNSLDSW